MDADRFMELCHFTVTRKLFINNTAIILEVSQNDT